MLQIFLWDGENVLLALDFAVAVINTANDHLLICNPLNDGSVELPIRAPCQTDVSNRATGLRAQCHPPQLLLGLLQPLVLLLRPEPEATGPVNMLDGSSNLHTERQGDR